MSTDAVRDGPQVRADADRCTTLELLAQAIHGVYLSENRSAGHQLPPDDPALQPWDRLSDALKDSNRDHARHLTDNLHAMGLAVAPLDGDAATLTEAEVEALSQEEHERWVTERRHAGWRAGPRDAAARTTPYLVPWDALSEEVRDLDRMFVRKLPDLLASVGLQVVRPAGWASLSAPAAPSGYDATAPDVVQLAWDSHRAWSRAADRLKHDRERQARVVLVLGLVGAALAAALIAAGAGSTTGRLLAFLSAASVGVAGVLKSRSGTEQVRDWTRARSVSEAIKSAVYVHLATGGDDDALDQRVTDLEEDASDLLSLKAMAAPSSAPPPPVRDLETYVRERVLEQTEQFYRPRARELERRAAVVRRVSLGLGVAGALLAAAAGTWQAEQVAAWVPVTTTMAAAITGQAAAARYDYLIVEYTRTAAELERLARRQRTSAALSTKDFVTAAERVISTENRGWMARLAKGDETT